MLIKMCLLVNMCYYNLQGNTLVLIRLLVVFMSLKTNQDKTERMKMK